MHAPVHCTALLLCHVAPCRARFDEAHGVVRAGEARVGDVFADASAEVVRTVQMNFLVWSGRVWTLPCHRA